MPSEAFKQFRILSNLGFSAFSKFLGDLLELSLIELFLGQIQLLADRQQFVLAFISPLLEFDATEMRAGRGQFGSYEQLVGLADFRICPFRNRRNELLVVLGDRCLVVVDETRKLFLSCFPSSDLGVCVGAIFRRSLHHGAGVNLQRLELLKTRPTQRTIEIQ